MNYVIFLNLPVNILAVDNRVIIEANVAPSGKLKRVLMGMLHCIVYLSLVLMT